MDDEDKGRGRGDKVYRVVVVDCPAGLFNEDRLTKREFKTRGTRGNKVRIGSYGQSYGYVLYTLSSRYTRGTAVYQFPKWLGSRGLRPNLVTGLRNIPQELHTEYIHSTNYGMDKLLYFRCPCGQTSP